MKKVKKKIESVKIYNLHSFRYKRFSLFSFQNILESFTIEISQIGTRVLTGIKERMRDDNVP